MSVFICDSVHQPKKSIGKTFEVFFGVVGGETEANDGLSHGDGGKSCGKGKVTLVKELLHEMMGTFFVADLDSKDMGFSTDREAPVGK